MADFQASSPSRVFRNNFIGDQSPAVYFQQASSSSGVNHLLFLVIIFFLVHFLHFL
ncbi:hypothetical protein Hanom_Chr10g00900021 [Helianthus anomalus]